MPVTDKSLEVVLPVNTLLIVAFFTRLTGYANFLSGMHYWKLDPVGLKVLEGYPRSIGMDFFGCSAMRAI